MPLDPEIKAAIEAAVSAAVAPVIQAANESVEGLKKKNSEILAEKKALQEAERRRKAAADTAQALRVADKFLSGNNAGSIPAGVIRATDTEMFVNRSLIQDPAEYRRLKGVAEERKLRMRIVDDQGADVPNVEPAVHKFEHKGVTYLSSHYIEDELGGPNGYARLRGDNPKQKFVAFRNLDGLSTEARAAHDEAMNAGGSDE